MERASSAPTTGVVERIRLSKRAPSPEMARAIRKAAGVPVQAIADELGVDRVTVHRWESGIRQPRGDNLRRYVELLEEIQYEVAA